MIETIKKILNPSTKWDFPGAVDGNTVVPFTPRQKAAASEADCEAEAVTEVELVLDRDGKPIWNMANALAVLTTAPEWRAVFGFNALTGRRVVMRALPDTGERIKGFRDLADDDYTTVRAWFCRNGYPRATKDVSDDAVRKVARDATFDPLTDYLSGLRWDGKKRIDTWLGDYLGVADAPTSRIYGRKWLISAVARALDPGCKADNMLVLEGEQGRKKSSALRTLTGGDWFLDGLPAMGTKDAAEQLAGRWIVEIAELDSMNKAGIEAAKAFITRQVESFRPAYAREVINQPRRCVFAGTTNRDNWLSDSSGGRRFWPVRVGIIDVEAVRRDRDQLWAEAVAAFRNKESWWLDEETEALARQDVAERFNADPWQPDVVAYVSGKAEVCIRDVLSEGLCIPLERRARAESNRVSTILQSIGWWRDGQFTTGLNKGQARYVPVH